MRGLIVTADDFGLHERVNDAVGLACSHGVLTCASLMVSAPAARHAVRIARAHPQLRVGLHLTLADGHCTSSPSVIPDLVDNAGRFGGSMFASGVRFFFLPHVRRQLAREIRAQFEAFAATGLKLDHVNAHKHFHVHPTVLSLIIEIGADFGMRCVRLPREWNGSPWIAPMVGSMKRRLDRAGIAYNDWVAGITWTGRMDENRFLDLLAQPPAGVIEIYCHPATRHDEPLSPSMKTYRHADELAALCSARVADAIAATGAMHGAFTDVLSARAA